MMSADELGVERRLHQEDDGGRAAEAVRSTARRGHIRTRPVRCARPRQSPHTAASHQVTHSLSTTTTTTTNVLIIVTLHKVAGALYISDLKKTMAVVRSQLYDS